MQETRASTDLKIGAGVSGHLDSAMAAEHAASRCGETLGGTAADFAIVFLSLHHVEAAGAIAHIIRKRLNTRTLIGCSAESVIGGELEMENAPGVSVFAARLPGVEVKTFTTDDLPMPRDEDPGVARAMALAMGIDPNHRASFLLADPYSVPLNTLLPVISRARADVVGAEHASDEPTFRRAAPILGGMASAALKPGANTMLVDDRVLKQGGVGLTLCGDVRVDALVSQGCKPVGSTFVVTGVKGQMLMTLGGRPAMDVLEELLSSIQSPTKEKMLKGGLFIGRAVSEYKDRFGRDDFLIRQVIGVEKTNRAIAVADFLRVGQTAQFHIRDAQTASEDLGLLLDAQKLYEPPAGVLLFTCNGRGTRLFNKPHHDAAAVCRAFAPTPGELAAKLGQAMPAPTHPVPLAGFFCAGEIGPVGNEIFVHGQTACAALFRPRL